jgi:hypothetical protein
LEIGLDEGLLLVSIFDVLEYVTGDRLGDILVKGVVIDDGVRWAREIQNSVFFGFRRWSERGRRMGGMRWHEEVSRGLCM